MKTYMLVLKICTNNSKDAEKNYMVVVYKLQRFRQAFFIIHMVAVKFKLIYLRRSQR